MKKIFKKICLLLILPLLLITFSNSVLANESIQQWPQSNKVNIDKEWKIIFNDALADKMHLSDYVYVLDSANVKQPVNVAYSEEENAVIIKPPLTGYNKNSKYTIVVDRNIASKNSKNLKRPFQKSFTTNNIDQNLLSVEKGTFVPRADSTNDITVVDNFYSIESSNIQSSNYDSGTLSLINSENLNIGDFIALPPNAQYPNGHVVEITKLTPQKNNIEATIVDADIKDYVKNVDISQQIEITSENVTLTSLQEHSKVTNVFSPVANNSQKVLSSVPSGFKIQLFDVNEKITKEKEGAYKGVKYDVSGTGNIVFDAEIIFEKPTATFDQNWLSGKKDFEFSAKQKLSVNAKVDGNLSGTIRYSLIEIAVPKLSLKTDKLKVGLFMNLDLLVTITANGTVEYKLLQNFNTVAGYYDKQPYANLNPTNKAEDPENSDDLNLESKVMMEAGLPISGDFLLFSDKLASLTLTPSISAEFEPNTILQNLLGDQLNQACLEMDIDGKFKAHLFITDSGLFNKGFDETIFSKNFDLLDYKSCVIEGLEFDETPETLALKEELKLKLLVKLINEKLIPLDLPHDHITFKSSDNTIATVDKNGLLRVANTARHNDKVKISAELKIGLKTYQSDVTFVIDKNKKVLEKIPYYVSYKLTNHLNKEVEVEIGLDSPHLRNYSKYEDAYFSNLTTPYYLTIHENGSAILSYINEPTHLPILPAGVTMEKTTETAYIGYKFTPNENVIIKNSNEDFSIVSLLLKDGQTGHYTSVAYNKDDDKLRYPASNIHVKFDYEVYGKYIQFDDELILINSGKTAYSLWLPAHHNLSIESTTEQGHTIIELNPGDSIYVKSKLAHLSAFGTITANSMNAKLDIISYSGTDNNSKPSTVLINSKDSDTEYYYGGFYTDSDSDYSKLTNSGSVPIRLYGANRSMTFFSK